MTRKLITKLMLLGICALCVSCSEKRSKYIIGVSQCSEDIWRNWQNSEMRMEANFHEGVELRFASALDDSKRQIQQIDNLVESGIDLLIVAPNQLSSVSPAIDRAYDKGIPVIVFERKTDSQKYGSFELQLPLYLYVSVYLACQKEITVRYHVAGYPHPPGNITLFHKQPHM